MKPDFPSVVWGHDKGTGNRIALVGMYDEIYVREDKGIGLPQCYFQCLILSLPNSLLKQTF